jgi:hypothetical protein
LQLSENPKNFIDLYNKILAYLIVNAPDLTLSLEEATPSDQVKNSNVVPIPREGGLSPNSKKHLE